MSARVACVMLGVVFITMGCAMGFTTWEFVRHYEVGQDWAFPALISSLFLFMGLGMLLMAPPP